MRTLAEAARSVLGIVADALRLLVARWPVLAAVFLLGATLHGALLWLAVAASNLSAFLAMLLLPLAPLASLVAMIVMLRILAPELPGLADSVPAGDRSARLRADVALTVQVLIPFLAVYASEGMVKADLKAFLFNATVDEFYNKGFAADFGRVYFATDAQAIVLIVAALVARKTIAGFDLGKDRLSVAGFAGYLEALWLVALASWFSSSIERIRSWVMGRAVIVGIERAFDDAVAVLGPIGHAIQSAVDQFASFVGSMGALVIVPVAWLAVGASIYGSSIPKATPLVTSEQMTKRIQRIPNPVRRVAAQVAEPVVSPVKNTLNAIRRVAFAGVLPMVFLCLLLAFASQLRVGVAGLFRTTLGPHPAIFWESVAPLIDVVAQCVYIVVAVAIIAATVNRIILSRRELEAAATQQATESPEASAVQAPIGAPQPAVAPQPGSPTVQ